jgi:uncharacterized membrane protein YeaQ/YmgE (transglycosylase-associated protein family)
MSLEYFFSIVVVGIVSGCGAHLLARYRGFCLVGDIAVASIGAFVGAWVLPAVGLSFGNDILTAALTSAIGAAAVLVTLRALKRA